MTTAQTQDQTYNGWSNYPTWCVNLWLSNDQGLYNDIRALAAQHQESRLKLADAIEEYVDDLLDGWSEATRLVKRDSFAGDLVGYAMSNVDWGEIADAWLEDVSAEVDS